MTYGTLNPVPSTDPRDLDDNAQFFDNALNSSAASTPDRLGQSRKTWHQMELDAAALVSPNVSALAALTAAVDKGVFFNAASPVGMATYTLTSFSRSLGAATDQATFRTAIGLGTSAVLAAGAANGVATLGADGKLPVSQLPPLAINETFTVANQAAMLALTAQRGDVAIRSDLAGAAYLLTADAPATLSNWVPIQQNLGTALTALSALTPATDTLPYFSGGATGALTAFPAQARTLMAATTAAAQRTALGVLAQTDKPVWATYTPTLTATTGTFTSASVTGKVLVLFGIAHVQIRITITTLGTGGIPNVTLPQPALAGSLGMSLLAVETAVNGKTGSAQIQASLTNLIVKDYNNGDLASASGAIINISGSYPVA